MAGAVFLSYDRRPRPPRAPEPSSSSSAVVAGPSTRPTQPTQFELLPMMTPAVWRGDTASGGEADDEEEQEPNPPPPAPAPRRRPLPLSHDVVLDRALPRATHRYGLSQAIARSVTLSLALAGLASALYLVARWRAKRGVAGVAIGAVRPFHSLHIFAPSQANKKSRMAWRLSSTASCWWI